MVLVAKAHCDNFNAHCNDKALGQNTLINKKKQKTCKITRKNKHARIQLLFYKAKEF